MDEEKDGGALMCQGWLPVESFELSRTGGCILSVYVVGVDNGQFNLLIYVIPNLLRHIVLLSSRTMTNTTYQLLTAQEPLQKSEKNSSL